MKPTTILAVCLQLAATVTALTFDKNGDKNVGNGNHTQFIGGQCRSEADCQSKCCATLRSAGGGICSGPDASFQNGKTGCGFVEGAKGGAGAGAGAGQANAAASSQQMSSGQQMSTGQQMDAGQQMNANQQMGAGQQMNAEQGQQMSATSAAAEAQSTIPANGGPNFDPAGFGNVGKPGAQFITGQCVNDANCQSQCCAGPSGICSGKGAKFQNGKTGCGFVGPKGTRFVRF